MIHIDGSKHIFEIDGSGNEVCGDLVCAIMELVAAHSIANKKRIRTSAERVFEMLKQGVDISIRTHGEVLDEEEFDDET